MSEAAAQEVEQADPNHGHGLHQGVDVAHPAEAELLPGSQQDLGSGADGGQLDSDIRRLIEDVGPPQPQLTIVVNSTHHLLSGETDSQFHNGAVDANDADDELDGPVHGGHGGRHNNNNNGGGRVDGRHHHNLRHHAGVGGVAFAGPATSATGAGGPSGGLILSREMAAAAADEGTGDVDGRSGLRGEMPHRAGGGTAYGAQQQIRRRGEKRKRAPALGQMVAGEGNGSVSGGSQSG